MTVSHIVDINDPVQRVLLVLLAVALSFLALTYVRPGTFITPARPTAPAAVAPTVIAGGPVGFGSGSAPAPPAAPAKPAAAATDPALGTTAAVAFTVVNTGTEPDRLLGASSEIGGDAAVVERTGNGQDAVTRPLTGGLPIPAGASVTLDPDGAHLLLTGVSQPEGKGDAFRVTLRFERAGEVEVPVQVRKSADKAQTRAAAPVAAGALRVENAWARAAEASDLRPPGVGGATPAVGKTRDRADRDEAATRPRDATPPAAS